MQASIFDQIEFTLLELWRFKKVALLLFVVISLVVIAIGWSWPKVYVSKSTIIVDEQNILTPLMEGTAIATSVHDHAKNAWQLLISQFAKDEVVEFLGDRLEGFSEKKIDEEWEEIKYRTTVSNVGKNLISISFKHKNPVEAQKFAAFFTDLFINESVKVKRRESESAYQFIADQANEYHEKLKSSEESLKEFRTENLSASPESAGTVGNRILELQRTIEETNLEIIEIEIQLKNIDDQLTGEAEVSAHLTEEGQLQKRISTMQTELDTLRMTYLDSYPDVIILKDQIQSLKRQMEQVRSQDKKEIVNAGNLNPLFQELRSQYSQHSTQLAALKTRLKATKRLLEEEKQRAIKINTADAVLAQLTRDYDVNKNLYQRLLRQRETARVSMNIDLANQGLTLKVREYPHVPVTPIGLRLMHFAIIGIFLGLMAPVGLVYLLVIADGKVRSKQQVQQNIGLPVLGEISIYVNEKSKRHFIHWAVLGVLTVSVVVSVYGYIAWLKIFS